MRFTTVTWTLSLLGLVAANPLVQSPNLDNKLAIRQNEGPEEFCDCTTCGTKRSVPADVIPILAQRDIPRPGQGQIDAWFSQQWSGGHVDEVPHQEEDDFTASFRSFQAESLLMGIKGMCGCTSVIIGSEIGGFISHHWERPYFSAALSGDDSLFQTHVISELRDSLPALGFDKQKQPNLKVGLYTKFDTSGRTLKYPNQVAEIKNTVAAAIPGLAAGDIVDIAYYTSKNPSESNDSSEGKVILSFTQHADDNGNAGFEVWAGSLRDSSGNKLDPANNNNPVLEAKWPITVPAESSPTNPAPLAARTAGS